MTTKKIDTGYFLQATANLTGAVGVFHAYAAEDRLQDRIDIQLCNKTGNTLYREGIEENGLRYGWLFSGAGIALDEVLVAKPKAGMRVIMCHGGTFICQGIGALLQEHGFVEVRADESHTEIVDCLLDCLLTTCQTETQVAALLEARKRMKASGILEVPTFLLRTWHLCLAGPPNAGKSSLLNRLTGFDRAFVHAEAGATRDAVGEMAEIAGYSVLIEDLPGFSGEKEGLMVEALARAELRLQLADVVAFVCDASVGWNHETEQAAKWVHGILGKKSEIAAKQTRRIILVLNKSDLGNTFLGDPWSSYFPDSVVVETSSLPDGDAAEDFASAFFQFMEKEKMQSD